MAMNVGVKRKQFTVDEYYRMGEAGIFAGDRVELIGGEIVEMSPIGSRHAACVKRLTALFSKALGERMTLSVQDPIRLGEYSEPEPDVALLHPRDDFYAQAHPEPEDVFLLVEVAETSLPFDREEKVPLYARAGILEVWLVDLAGGVVTVYRHPAGDHYEEVQVLAPGETLSPQQFPDLDLAVAEIVGEVS